MASLIVVFALSASLLAMSVLFGVAHLRAINGLRATNKMLLASHYFGDGSEPNQIRFAHSMLREGDRPAAPNELASFLSRERRKNHDEEEPASAAELAAEDETGMSERTRLTG